MPPVIPSKWTVTCRSRPQKHTLLSIRLSSNPGSVLLERTAIRRNPPGSGPSLHPRSAIPTFPGLTSVDLLRLLPYVALLERLPLIGYLMPFLS